MDKVQQRIILTALTVLVFLLVATYLLTMPLGPAMFFLTPAGLDFSQTVVRPPMLFLLVFAFYVPFELNTGQLFMLTWGVFALCFVVAWRLRENFHEVVGKAFSRPLNKIFNNWLFAMPIIASMLLTAVVSIISLQDLFGVPTGEIPTPKTDAEFFTLYLDLSYFSVIEEVGFRISPIGTFLLTYLLLNKSVKSAVTMSFRQRFKLFLFSFLYPDGAKKMIGEKTVAVDGILNGISKGEWAIILITSIAFGVAHILSGIGWEVGKVTSTFFQGFVFAIVYLAYGFQAPILMHWFFNYYFYTYTVSTKYYASASDISALIVIINLTLGSLGLIAFTIWGFKRILKRWKTVMQQPSAFAP